MAAEATVNTNGRFYCNKQADVTATLVSFASSGISLNEFKGKITAVRIQVLFRH